MDDVQLVEYYEGLWTKLEKAERVYGWLKPSYAHYVILLSIAGFQWFIRLQVSKRNKFTVYMTVIDPSKQVVGDRLILNRSISPYDNFLIEEGSFSNLKDVIRSADEKMRIRICADYLFNLSNSLVEYEKDHRDRFLCHLGHLSETTNNSLAFFQGGAPGLVQQRHSR